MLKRLIQFILITGLLSTHTQLMAGELLPNAIQDSEFPMLPKYCWVRIKLGTDRSNPEVDKWYRIIGPRYMGIHHYCWGLNYINRANKEYRDMKRRSYYLENAVSGIQYVIGDKPEPDFSLLPEVHVSLGRVYVMQRKYSEAVKEYSISISIKNDYDRAYMALSDLHKKMGNKEEALKVVNEGLKYVPDSKGLKRRLRKLKKEQ